MIILKPVKNVVASITSVLINKKLKKFTLTIWKSSGRSCLFLSKFPILCTKLVGTAVYVVSKKRGKL